jgi:hypothetical protein
MIIFNLNDVKLIFYNYIIENKKILRWLIQNYGFYLMKNKSYMIHERNTLVEIISSLFLMQP